MRAACTASLVTHGQGSFGLGLFTSLTVMRRRLANLDRWVAQSVAFYAPALRDFPKGPV